MRNKKQNIQIQLITIFKKISREDKSIIGNYLYHKPFKNKKTYNRAHHKKQTLKEIQKSY